MAEAPQTAPQPSPAPELPSEPEKTKQERLGLVGRVVAILAGSAVVAAFLAWFIGPWYLYQGLVAVSAGHPWLFWAGLPVLALLCLIGWLIQRAAAEKAEGKDKK